MFNIHYTFILIQYVFPDRPFDVALNCILEIIDEKQGYISFIPEGIIRPVVRISALTWFITYIYI